MGAARAEAPAGTLEIRLASGTALEQRGREQLERLLATHDLSRWLFTRTVQIQSRVIPHSHPVLTLNMQYLDNDAAQLASFLHEQLHWFLVQNQAKLSPRLRHWNVCIPRFQRRHQKGPTAEAARSSTWSFVSSSSLTPCVTSSGRQRHTLHSGPSDTTRGCIARCSNGPRQSGRSYAHRVLECQTHAAESSTEAMDGDVIG